MYADHLANAGDPDQALRLRRGEHAIAELVVEAANLRFEQVMLSGLQLGVQAREFREGGSGRHVVPLQHRADGALALQTATHEQEPRAQQIADLARPLADHMRLRNQLHARQLGHHGRVDGIGFHLGVADGLEILGVRKAKVNALWHREIPHPVPQAGALADGLVRTFKGREVRGHGGAVRREVRLPHDGASGIDSVDGEGPLVEIDASVEHTEGSRSKGDTEYLAAGPRWEYHCVYLDRTFTDCSLFAALTGRILLKGPARERER